MRTILKADLASNERTKLVFRVSSNGITSSPSKETVGVVTGEPDFDTSCATHDGMFGGRICP